LLEQHPSHLGAHRNLAVLFEESGQLEEAERHLHAIIKMYPQNAFHLSQLGRFYDRVGWSNKAKAVFQKAEKIEPAKEKRKLRPLLKSR
jgi:Flp pilus assembly protein TadD